MAGGTAGYPGCMRRRSEMTAPGCSSTGSGREGLTKAKAALDEWCKDVAPSSELRKWYNHDPGRFENFGRRYQAELQDPGRAGVLAHLRELAKVGS